MHASLQPHPKDVDAGRDLITHVADSRAGHGRARHLVDAWFADRLPPMDAVLDCELDERRTVTAVVHAHLGNSSVRAIATGNTRGMRRGAAVTCQGLPLRIPVGQQLVGRVIDLHGRPLDGGPNLSCTDWLPLYRSPPSPSVCRGLGDVYPTGIKVIDLFCPFTHGGRVAVFGGAGVGKTVVLTEFIRNAISDLQGIAVFAGIGERSAKASNCGRSCEIAASWAELPWSSVR